jgi:hypothetical protein
MFRRPRFRPLRAQQMLGALEMSRLREANELMATGQPEKAASVFLQLARQMQSSQHPRKAANLHAMAANAFADAKQEAPALQQAQVALRFFLQLQMMPRVAQFYGNIRNKMNQNGMSASVADLEKEFGNALANLPAHPMGSQQTNARHLPTSCPKCGAALRSDEVEWLDASTASCSFCGSVIATE